MRLCASIDVTNEPYRRKTTNLAKKQKFRQACASAVSPEPLLFTHLNSWSQGPFSQRTFTGTKHAHLNINTCMHPLICESIHSPIHPSVFLYILATLLCHLPFLLVTVYHCSFQTLIHLSLFKQCIFFVPKWYNQWL